MYEKGLFNIIYYLENQSIIAISLQICIHGDSVIFF